MTLNYFQLPLSTFNPQESWLQSGFQDIETNTLKVSHKEHF